jgi:hypothetical protein
MGRWMCSRRRELVDCERRVMNDRFGLLGYRVHLAEEEGVWVATARRPDNGDSFGPPVAGDRADEAADLLARWLEWQQAHTTALTALQTAIAAIAGLTSPAPKEGEGAAGDGEATGRLAVRDALIRVDERRRELDRIRGQKPWPH